MPIAELFAVGSGLAVPSTAQARASHIIVKLSMLV